MLNRNTKPRSRDALLEQRECRLYHIGCDAEAFLVSHVLILGVINTLMFAAIFCIRKVIEIRVISQNHIHGRIHILFNDVVRVRLIDICGMNEMQMPVPLTETPGDCPKTRADLTDQQFWEMALTASRNCDRNFKCLPRFSQTSSVVT